MIKGKTNSFPEIRITSEMIDRAADKSREMGRIKNSITGGEKNLIGFLGEEIVAKYLKGKVSNTYEYDVILGDKLIEVKTKDTTAYPKKGYEVSVAGFNTRQKCNYYVFTRILSDLSVGWILGYMSRKEYYEKARKMTKDEVDGTNNFVVKADCWNMFISDLKPIKDLL
jgi:uncharacterized protein with LGFP repeats